VPLDTHEWISFEDDNHRRTWVFDATFLRSNWSCVYGAGCKGVLDDDATHMGQGCCSYGAHFIDEEDVQTVVMASARLRPHHWQFIRKGKAGGILDSDDGVTTTRLVDGACIFLNRPGFKGGSGCAFHHLAAETGERKMDLQPDVCWQLPLRLDDQTDDYGYNIVRAPVHIHDLNATILHALGYDHKRLTYRFQGRDYRLTDVHGELVSGVLG